MRKLILVWRVIRFLPVLPIALVHLTLELLHDGLVYLIGSRREARWPEPSSASTLL